VRTPDILSPKKKPVEYLAVRTLKYIGKGMRTGILSWRFGRIAVAAMGCALYPRHCHGCRTTLAGTGTHGICATCFSGLAKNLGPRCLRCDLPQRERHCPLCPAAAASLAHIRAPLLYAGILPTLVRAGKFCGDDAVWPSLAQYVAEDSAARKLIRPGTILLPIPLGAQRARARSYNQSSLLAQTLSRAWRVPVAYGLYRRGNTLAQSHLTLTARHRNLRGAFVCSQVLRGEVVLVDDVVTSGGTLSAAAAAVRQAGATVISAVAVARTVAFAATAP
jgi:ComF family protein